MEFCYIPGVLTRSDFYRDAYTGEVDTATGFALVASAEKCFVWNYSQVRSYTGLRFFGLN